MRFTNAGLSESPKVAILLCTLNGSAYLDEQITSIARQTHSSWFVRASDDGSSDNTRTILAGYQASLGEEKFSSVNGPSKGFAANFLSLACNDRIQADFYAYCDQDDIWNPEKLERALNWFESVPADIPALYCARTLNIDETGRKLGLSPRRSRPASFANALVQNIAGGNTFVFNHAAKALISLAGPQVRVVAHDWWTYLVVSGCGGRVHHDSCPNVYYRQHGNNHIGHGGWGWAWLNRLRLLWQANFRSWSAIHINALNGIREQLTLENQQRLDHFARARDGSLSARLAAIWRSGVYRQTVLGNFGILVAVFFRKM